MAGQENECPAPILKLCRVGFRYSSRTGLFRRKSYWALRGISFALGFGETLGIIGRNGAGKSTLLRLLAGIVSPDEGVINHRYSYCHLLSFHAGFNPHLTGRENIIMRGLLTGHRYQEIKSSMESIVDFSGLKHVINEPLKSYSTGMKARLGFAIAFQVDSDLILMDEIMGVGDTVFKRKATDVMRAKIRSERSVVLVSHNHDIIRELCDRVLWIEDGMIQAQGDPGVVLQHYRSAVFEKNQIDINHR